MWRIFELTRAAFDVIRIPVKLISILVIDALRILNCKIFFFQY